jgi:hypothetical protein
MLPDIKELLVLRRSSESLPCPWIALLKDSIVERWCLKEAWPWLNTDVVRVGRTKRPNAIMTRESGDDMGGSEAGHDGVHVHGEMINNNAASEISDPVAARARFVAVPGGGEAIHELIFGTTM